MMLDLTEEETDALARLLSRTIDDDRYPLSPRIHTLKTVLAKIRPEPVREPLPRQRSMRHRELLAPNGNGADRLRLRLTARCAANNVATADLNKEGGAMQLPRTPLTFVVLGGLTGCYPPTPSTYAPLPALTFGDELILSAP
jgi:hypothetical protein